MMRVIGCMSGTSADAIDVVALDAELAGAEIRCSVIGHGTAALPSALRTALLAALPPAATSAGDVCRLDTGLGQAFAAAARFGLDELCGGVADLVVVSGQTLFHDVDGARCLGTLQLGQPAWVAERTGLPVVSDLRSRDVAAGGRAHRWSGSSMRCYSPAVPAAGRSTSAASPTCPSWQAR